MKDPKSLYLLIIALIVVTISFVLISFWGYRYYFHKPPPDVQIQKSTFRNELHKEKALASNKMADTTMIEKMTPSSGDTDAVLQQKLAEIDTITSDIRKILSHRRSPSLSEETSAQIAALKQSLDDLRSQNYEVQKENARLNKMMEELLAAKTVNKKREDLKSGKSANTSGYDPIPLLVAHLRFAAFTQKKTPASFASNTAYLNGSFLVNIKSANSSPRIYVVIIQPDGEILLEDPSKPHAFKTGAGTKAYSVAIPFNSETDNQKRLYFSVHLPVFKKGEYKMHIYHQGILIGKMDRTLY